VEGKMSNTEEFTFFDETKTAPAIVLNFANVLIGKISGKKNILPLWGSAFLLGICLFIPSYVFALLLGEVKQLREIGWTVFTALELGYLSVILMYIDINKNILGTLRRKIIPIITSEKDLEKLGNCLQLAATKKYLPSMMILGITMGLTAYVGGTLAYGHNPGVGLPLNAIFAGIFSGISLHYLMWVLILARLLGGMNYVVNEFTPASSKIIEEISLMLNKHIYLVALFTAVVTIVDSLDPLTSWFVWVIILFGWIPITTQFFLNQSTIRRIISNAKWSVLELIQSEIRTLKNTGPLQAKETTDAINRLMDLHERIEKTRSSTFDFKAGLNFLNQLMLPVLGWVIGNVEKLLSYLKSIAGLLK
jgi:hypothetical protein